MVVLLVPTWSMKLLVLASLAQKTVCCLLGTLGAIVPLLVVLAKDSALEMFSLCPRMVVLVAM
jgi:hypothetical protein